MTGFDVILPVPKPIEHLITDEDIYEHKQRQVAGFVMLITRRRGSDSASGIRAGRPKL